MEKDGSDSNLLTQQHSFKTPKEHTQQSDNGTSKCQRMQSRPRTHPLGNRRQQPGKLPGAEWPRCSTRNPTCICTTAEVVSNRNDLKAGTRLRDRHQQWDHRGARPKRVPRRSSGLAGPYIGNTSACTTAPVVCKTALCVACKCPSAGGDRDGSRASTIPGLDYRRRRGQRLGPRNAYQP